MVGATVVTASDTKLMPGSVEKEATPGPPKQAPGHGKNRGFPPFPLSVAKPGRQILPGRGGVGRTLLPPRAIPSAAGLGGTRMALSYDKDKVDFATYRPPHLLWSLDRPVATVTPHRPAR